jgi:hypothetical protein
MKKLSIVIFLVISLALVGCAGMSDTEQRTLSGGAIGAGAGAVVGAIAGHTGLGLAVGAAAGVAGGYLRRANSRLSAKLLAPKRPVGSNKKLMNVEHPPAMHSAFGRC